MNRKRWIALGALVCLLAAVFCLWYTRPRSFQELIGEEEFRNYSMAAVVMGNRGGEIVSESWHLASYDEGREDTIGAFRELLESCRYRVRLRNLLPFPGSYSRTTNQDIRFIQLGAVLEDDSYFSATYEGASVLLFTDGGTVFARAEDEKIGEKLLAFVQEYGSDNDS